MHAKDKHLRLIHMLLLLPPPPRTVSVETIHAELADLGYECSRRTVERDMHLLCSAFPLVSDNHSPAGWSRLRSPLIESLRYQEARHGSRLSALAPCRSAAAEVNP